MDSKVVTICEKLKKFSDDIDMIWICGFLPATVSFKHIDLPKVAIIIMIVLSC